MNIIYDNIIIAYGKNSREILMIGIDVPEIIQKYEIDDCYYCGKVDETSFLVQDKMYLNLFSFESNILQLIGKYEFKCNFDNRLLRIPNRRFIFIKNTIINFILMINFLMKVILMIFIFIVSK